MRRMVVVAGEPDYEHLILSDMTDSRRYLSTFAVVSLVLLRLVIGWHFYGEGTKKVEYDRHNNELRLARDFSAEGFLTEAKGPLAGWFRSQAPGDHNYRELLAVPRRDAPGGEEEPPYHAWAEQIKQDWLELRDRAKAVTGITDEQRQRIDAAYDARVQQLENYLGGESDAIAEYQHELWRLQNWQSAPEAGEVPFHDERVATKAAETRGATMPWVSQVRQLDADFMADVRGVLTTEQREDAATNTAMSAALTSEKQAWLSTVNLGVTILTISVGICLLLGFLTRLAAIAGALFLLAVIATQPPWLADAAPTMSQMIEFAGLLVLAGTGAGRWAGLDYFGYALFHRRREAEPT